MGRSTDHDIVLFDGLCNFCDASVRFILRHDRHGRFRFAPLQSAVGERHIRQHRLDASTLDTLIVIERGRAYARSDAALRIARLLGPPWSLTYALTIVPRPVRDAVYDWFARRRYRWFGRRDDCTAPSPDVRDRFLTS